MCKDSCDCDKSALTPKERVEVELDDTLGRLTALRKLLNQGEETVKEKLGITQEAYDLLERQKFVMADYVDILRQRLDIWDI